MGIKHLNSYFRSKCTDYSISQKHLSVYRNKKFVIDTSIYLYRFLSENALIENMYLALYQKSYYTILIKQFQVGKIIKQHLFFN